jgi:hypothetical protein
MLMDNVKEAYLIVKAMIQSMVNVNFAGLDYKLFFIQIKYAPQYLIFVLVWILMVFVLNAKHLIVFLLKINNV